MKKILQKSFLFGVSVSAVFFGGAGVLGAQSENVPVVSGSSTSDVAVEIILDSSQKMKKDVDGKEAFQILYENLPQLMRELPEGTPVAVRTYGHRVGTREKAKSCQDSELISPLGSVDSGQIVSQVSKLSTKGFSPLAYSLKTVPSDISDLENKKLVLVVIASASDSCGGDVAAAGEGLKTLNTGMTVFGINFFGDNAVKEELLGVSEFSEDGKVVDVVTEGDAKSVLNDVGKEIAAIIEASETESEDVEVTGPAVVDNGDGDVVDNGQPETSQPVVNEPDNAADKDQDLSVAAFNFTQTSLFKYGIGGVVVILILIGGTYFVIGRKKKKLAMQSNVGQSAAPIAAQPQPPVQAAPQAPAAPPPVAPAPTQQPPVTPTPVIKPTPPTPKPPVQAQAAAPQPADANAKKVFNLGDIKAAAQPQKDESVSLDRMIAPDEEN